MGSECSGVRDRLPVRLVALIVVIAAALVVCAPAGAGDTHYACPSTIANCTVVTGSPVDLPGGYGIDTIIKHDQLKCPSGIPVGYSYSTANVGQTQVFVHAYQSYPNTNDVWNPDPRRVFFGIVHTGDPATVQDQIGCAPERAVSLLRGAPLRHMGRGQALTARLDPSQARAAAPATAAEPRYECPPSIVDCTTVTGGWLDVPTGNFFQGRDVVVRDQLTCPSGLPVGFTYSGGNRQDSTVLVQVFRGTRGPNPNTVFFGIVNWGPRTTVQLRIGCAPAPTASTLGGGSVRPADRAQTRTVSLEPAQTRAYTRGCPGGMRLVTGEATVEFTAHHKPSAAQLAAVRWRTARRANSETVRVTTTRALGRSRAELNMVALCAPA